MAQHTNKGVIISKDPKVLRVDYHDPGDPLYSQTQFFSNADYIGNFKVGDKVKFDWYYNPALSHPFYADALEKI